MGWMSDEKGVYKMSPHIVQFKKNVWLWHQFENKIAGVNNKSIVFNLI